MAYKEVKMVNENGNGYGWCLLLKTGNARDLPEDIYEEYFVPRVGNNVWDQRRVLRPGDRLFDEAWEQGELR